MIIVFRILFIFACIWLFFALFGKQLLKFVFGSSGDEPNCKRGNREQKKEGGASVIPDDVGNYVDFTETKF